MHTNHAYPVGLEDEIGCVNGWALARNGTHGGTRGRTRNLFPHLAAGRQVVPGAIGWPWE
ncbi:hypothetical protein [Nocardia sp. CY41]|uniref:hypothetical protein n=1 Tax=Nocardia sp. CY41 TaxID=2608686 RepID=UPI0013596C7E|nr:hypothetical protein [Nocardia sp. CY41]